jgi:cytochrome c-type biogenesis protein CcsB
MSLADYAQLSNYAVASATGVVGLAFLAHLAEWGFAKRSAEVPVRVGAAGAEEPETDERPDLSTIFSSVGVSLTALAVALLAAGSLTRGIAAQRVPWSNMYEFATTGSLIALAVYLVLVRIWSVEWVGGLVTGFALVLLGIGFSVYVPAGPIVPALHSYWLVIHVAAVMIAGALFLVGAAASLLFLLKSRAEARGIEGAFLARVPSAVLMDRVAFRVNAVAFPIWTFGALIAGPIWAYNAWSRYWGWDPKEVWALITWIVYAGYLHARVTAGWKGRRAAIIGLIGFATFLFSFYGVNLLFGGSQHTYAK